MVCSYDALSLSLSKLSPGDVLYCCGCEITSFFDGFYVVTPKSSWFSRKRYDVVISVGLFSAS